MRRVSTVLAMRAERVRESSRVSSENGATWPGRWQEAQRLKMIGAASLLKVTGCVGGAASGTPEAGDSTGPSATRVSIPARKNSK